MIILLIFSLLVLTYTFFLYPLVVYLLAKVKGSQKQRYNRYEKPITIVLVACNESKYIEKKIHNLLNLKYPKELIKIIIVDDASDDNTLEIIESNINSQIKVIKQEQRSGKAQGINKALSEVNTELVLLVDARQVVSGNALNDLSSWFTDNNVVAVSGELKLEESKEVSSGVDFYQKYERFIRLNESKFSSVPGVSGAIYMLRVANFKEIPEDTILDDVLIPMNAARKGGWIGVDDRVTAIDVPSNDLEREKKRKIRTLNGNYQLLFRNLSWCIPFVHPHWFVFICHKVLRLLAPIFMVTSILSSIYLAIYCDIYFSILSLSLIFGLLTYPLTIKYPSFREFKLIRIASAFVALNWFNVLGFYSYISSNKSKSWK